ELGELRSEAAASSREELEASIGVATSSARAALSRATKALTTEVIAERRRSFASEEALGAKLRRSEELSTAEAQSQAQSLERLAEAVTEASDKRSTEDRSLWAKVHELSRSTKERKEALE
ncbi:unnamed protein product, partial [Polarella glacialis]